MSGNGWSADDLGPDDSAARFRWNRALLDSGDIIKVSEVSRMLMLRQRFGVMEPEDDAMLAEANQRLIEDLRASRGEFR